METRSARIMAMASKVLERKDRIKLQDLDIPYYESTKGTESSERDLAIQGYYKNITNLQSPKPVCIVSPWNSKIKETNQDMNAAPNHSRARVNLTRIFTDEMNLQFPHTSTFTSNELVSVASPGAPSDISDPYYDSGSEYVPSIVSSISDAIMESNDENSDIILEKQLAIVFNTKKQKSKEVMSRKRKHSSVSEDIEENCEDGSSENVNIKPAQTVNGNRVRDKGHSCYFCHQFVINNLARHFEIKHKDEMDVARILAKPKGSRERRDAFMVLARAGDFYHNCSTLALKKGELILSRRPNQNEMKYSTYTDYGPCPECLGFMIKKHIWHHLKYSCKSILIKKTKDTDYQNRNMPTAESSALLNGILGTNVTAEFTMNIINKFKNDDIAVVCKEDSTIVKFGAFLFEKYDTTQSELIRQSMRQLGRLTIELRKLHNGVAALKEFLVPEKFDMIVNATKQICVTTKEVTKRPEFAIPSLALKIGYALRKCISIERGQALRAGNLKSDKNFQSFLTLLDLEWSVRISSNALQTLYTRKKTATDLLPITSDLVKLSNFIDKEINNIKNSISNMTFANWTKLASLTLSRIILFNKRRSGEAARMTMIDYASRPSWDSSGTQEMKDSLTSFENKLASTLTIVRITGKRGRIVPVLLTMEMKESLDTLILNRVKCGIANENPYIFALTNTSASHMRGHDCLKKWCIEAELESPDLITSTKLRKYVATVCQIFNLSENEYDWLARHLGHDVRVHREFYRLQENAVELTKISRLLLAVDQGEAHKYSGKELKDINIEDLPNIVDENNDKKDNNDDEEEEDDRNEMENGDDDLKIITADLIQTENSRKNLKEMKKSKGKQIRKRTDCSGKRDYSGRKPWSTEEKEIILKEFTNFIKSKSLPGKDKCCGIIDKNPGIFIGRKWSDLKYYIKNYLSKINKTTSHAASMRE